MVPNLKPPHILRNLHVRPMRVEDIPKVIAVEEEVFDDAWSEDMFLFEILGVSGVYPYLAFEVTPGKQVLAGYVIFARYQKYVHLMNIAAAPGFTRKGLGRVLLTICLHYAVEMQKDFVFLEVREDNTSAKALYTAFGFETVGRKENFYGPGIHADLQCLNLRDQRHFTKALELITTYNVPPNQFEAHRS